MRGAAALLLGCLLAGCAASPRIDVDPSKAATLVVRGHFESGAFRRTPGCASDDLELMKVINCGSGPQSFATFVIDESFVGATARKRFRLSFYYGSYMPELKLGRRYQYLATLVSDGVAANLEGIARLGRVANDQWAIPITIEEERYVFPCSMYVVTPKPLKFLPPRPRESIADLEFDAEDVDDATSDGSYSADDGYLYANKGVLLEHARDAYEGKSPEQLAGECH